MADEIVGSIGVAFEGDYSALADDFATAVQMASDAGQKMAAALNDAFSSVSLTIPPGSISMGSIAADLAQEIAQAFANTPINLNLSTETATSAAADVAQEIAGAFANTPINLNIAPVDDSAAVAAAQEIAGAFGQISIPAPNTDEFVAGLDAIKGPLADVSSTTIDWTGVLDKLNSSLDDVGGSAADQAASITALEEGMAAAGEAAQNYAGSAEEIHQKQLDADEALADARQALEQIIDAYGRGEASENELATATANVESAFQKANPAIHDSGAAAEDAGAKLGTMGEQLLALGEALAITEGLKEFGSEALTAADNVTRTTIALTALTGDGNAAKETIEKLEALGISDGLAFPSLLEAGQRMQVLLGDAVDIPDELGKIANAAVAMHTSIDAAARMFDNMAANGVVMKRSLGDLGLTMDSLADAVNQVNPALGANAENITKVFRAMDQSDRIDALNLAFQKFDGIAQEVAKTTFTQQWTVLANQWDSVMVEIGKDIMPVVTGLMSLISTDVLPFIKSLADDFAALPAPVKDVAVGLGLAAAAVVPMIAGLAGAALAMKGLTEASELVTGFLTTIGVLTPEVAAETTTLAAAQAALASTTGAVVVAEGALATEATPGLIAAMSSLAFEAAALSTAFLDEAVASIATFAGTSIPAAITSLGIFVGETLPAAITELGLFAGGIITDAVAALGTLSFTAIPAAVASMGVFIAETLPAAIAGLGTFALEAVATAGASLVTFATTAVSGAALSLTSMATSALPLAVGALSALTSAVGLAAGAFAGFELGSWLYNNSTAMQSFGDSVGGVINKFHDWIDSFTLVNSVMAALGDPTAKANLATAQLAQSAEMLHTKLLALGVDIPQGSMSLQDWDAKLVSAATHIGTVGDSTGTAHEKLSLFQAQTDGAAASMAQLQANVDSANEKLVNAAAAYETAKTKGDDLTKVTANLAKAHSDAEAATAALDKAQTSAAVSAAALLPPTKSLTEQWTTAVTKLREFVPTMQAIPGAEEAATNAADAHQVKLQLLSDKLVAAQAHLADLDAKFGEGLATRQQVADATDKVTAAQAALDKELGPAPATLDAVGKNFVAMAGDADQTTANLNQLIGAATNAPPAITPLNQAMIDLGSKASAAGVDTQTLLSDIKTLASDSQTPWEDLETYVGNFDSAMKTLAQTDLPSATKAYGDMVQSLIDSHAPHSQLVTDLQNEQGYIHKLAQEDLPAAIDAEKRYVDQVSQIPGAFGQAQQAQQSLLQYEIQWAHQSGQDASAYLIALDQLRYKLSGAGTDTLYQAYRDIQQVASTAFGSIGQAMTGMLEQTQGLGTGIENVFKSVFGKLYDDVVQLALAPLQKDINQTIGALVGSGPGSLPGAAAAAGAGMQPLTTAAADAAAATHNLDTASVDLTGVFDETGQQMSSAVTGMSSAVDSASKGLSSNFTALGAAVVAAIPVLSQVIETILSGRPAPADQTAQFFANAGVNLNDPATAQNIANLFGITVTQSMKNDFNIIEGQLAKGIEISSLTQQQLSQALTNQQTYVDTLTKEQEGLKAEIILASDQNNQSLVTLYNAQLTAVNSQLTSAQNTLKLIQDASGVTATATSYAAQATTQLSIVFGKNTDETTKTNVLLELLQSDQKAASTDLVNAQASGTAAQITAAEKTQAVITAAFTALEQDKSVPAAIADLQAQLTANDNALAAASGDQVAALTLAHNAIVGAINMLTPYDQQTATNTAQISYVAQATTQLGYVFGKNTDEATQTNVLLGLLEHDANQSSTDLKNAMSNGTEAQVAAARATSDAITTALGALQNDKSVPAAIADLQAQLTATDTALASAQTQSEVDALTETHNAIVGAINMLSPYDQQTAANTAQIAQSVQYIAQATTQLNAGISQSADEATRSTILLGMLEQDYQKASEDVKNAVANGTDQQVQAAEDTRNVIGDALNALLNDKSVPAAIADLKAQIAANETALAAAINDPNATQDQINKLEAIHSELVGALGILNQNDSTTAQNTTYIAQATGQLNFVFGKATDASTEATILLGLLDKDLQAATADLNNATSNGTAAQIEAATTTKNAIVEAITALQNDKTVSSAVEDLQKQLTANDDSMARASGAQLQALTDAHNAIVGAINLLQPYNQQTATATTQTAANTSTGNLVSPLQAALASGNIALATQILNSTTGTASTTTAVTQLPSAIGSAVGSVVTGVISAPGPGVMTTPGFIPGGTGPAGSPFGLTRIPLEQLYTALGLTPPDDVSGKFVPYNYMGGAMGLGQQASQFFGTGVPTYASVGIQQAGQLKYSYPINVVSAGTGVAILCANPDGTISTIFDWKGEHATDASFVPPPSDVWNAMMSAGNVAIADDQARQTWAQRVADAVKNAASTGTPYTPPNPVTGQGGGTNPPPTTGTGTFNPISSGAPPPPLVPPPLPTPILPGSGTPPPVLATGGTGGGTPPFVPPIGPFGAPPPGTGNPFGPIQTPPGYIPPSGAEGPPPPGTGNPLGGLQHPPPSTIASADATTQAVKELTSTISGLQGQANSLQNQLINAVASGDQTSIDAINSQLSGVNSKISTETGILNIINTSINAAAVKQLDATIEGMKGSKATTDQISTAIGNEQAILKGYQDQQKQLQQDLIQAVADGNTDLVTEIQKQQSTIAGEIQATQSLLSAVGGSAATGTGTFAASSSVSGGGSSNTLVGGTSFSSASYSGGGGTSGTSASGTFNISAGTLLLSLGDLAGQASVSDSIAQLIHQSTVGAVPKGAVNAFTQMISAGQVYLEMRVGSVYASSGVGALIAAAGIPSFDVGGYVPRDMVAQLHAGETVIPPGGAGGGNISVVINVSGSGNPRQVATEIMSHLKRVSPRFAMAAS